MGLICPGCYCTCQENTYFVPASLIFIHNRCIIFNIDHPLGLQALMAPYGFYKLPKQLKLPPMPLSACVLIAATCFPLASRSSLTLLTFTRTPLLQWCIFPAHYTDITPVVLPSASSSFSATAAWGCSSIFPKTSQTTLTSLLMGSSAPAIAQPPRGLPPHPSGRF